MSGKHFLQELDEPEQLVLSDLINRVLDKGVMIRSQLTISIADIDLIQLELNVLISSVAAAERSRSANHADVPVRTPARP